MSPTVAVFLVGLALPRAAHPDGPETRVRVWIHDYAGVPASTLADAEAKARRLFRSAGVNIMWINHRISPDAPPLQDEECDLYPGPADLQLRIVEPAMARRIPASCNSLGYSWLAEGFGNIAGIFYHRAFELAKETPASLSDILGCIMAHEIGHLLIGDGSHSASGIMRDQWDEDDFKMMARGWLLFQPEQAGRIAANAAKRQAAAIGKAEPTRLDTHRPVPTQKRPGE